MRASAKTGFARFFRAAVLIHIFALATGGIAGLLGSMGNPSAEVAALLGVSISATLVLYFWSLILITRSCARGEPLQPIVTLAIIILLELLILFSSLLKAEPTQKPGTLLEYADYYGVSFFAAFLIVLSFVAAPLAWRRVRRQIAAAGSAPHYTEVYKRAARQYAIHMAALTALLLPLTMFYYCVKSTTYTGGAESWRVLYIQSTPDFFRDSICDVLSIFPTKSNKSLHLKMMEHRWVSKTHLEKQLTSEPLLRQTALCSLLRDYSPESLGHALTVASSGPKRAFSGAAFIIAKFGTAEQIRKLLNSDSSVAMGFRNEFIDELSVQRKNQFVPELKALIKRDVLSRTSALQVLAGDLSAEDFLNLWPDYLATQDADLRVRAARALNHHPSNPLPVVVAALKKCDGKATADLMRNYSIGSVREWRDDNELKEWLKALSTLAQSSDPVSSNRAKAWLNANFEDRTESEQAQLSALREFIDKVEHDWTLTYPPTEAPDVPSE